MSEKDLSAMLETALKRIDSHMKYQMAIEKQSLEDRKKLLNYRKEKDAEKRRADKLQKQVYSLESEIKKNKESYVVKELKEEIEILHGVIASERKAHVKVVYRIKGDK